MTVRPAPIVGPGGKPNSVPRMSRVSEPSGLNVMIPGPLMFFVMLVLLLRL